MRFVVRDIKVIQNDFNRYGIDGALYTRDVLSLMSMTEKFVFENMVVREITKDRRSSRQRHET